MNFNPEQGCINGFTLFIVERYPNREVIAIATQIAGAIGICGKRRPFVAPVFVADVFGCDYFEKSIVFYC